MTGGDSSSWFSFFFFGHHRLEEMLKAGLDVLLGVACSVYTICVDH
ncbi:hypothetical protein J7K27_04135 [Candidatus Bathyarchaeota archaeon]|nr:hypothetical protein [Candidatus Bathyarchaeota archaeon]